jgi:phosphatidylserine/phosphatidylglycerophosphate/cardiolipin synthase-like enzyme
MVHVTEENVAVIDVDLLIHECIRASEGKESFAYVISPFLSDYEISPSWSMFASNVINISDVDSFLDLLGLLKHSGVDINVVTRSPRDLAKTTIDRRFIEKQARLITMLDELGCEIRTNPSLHAKATVTSKGVLSGSFNLTKSGRMFNLETGFYFPNTSGVEKEEYEEKLKWAKQVFREAKKLEKTDLEYK